MLVYHYDDETFVYLGSAAADINPLDTSEHFLPAHATFIAPPTIPEGQQAVFAEGNETWSLEDIPATPSISTPLPEFSTMTVEEKLTHYSLGGLVDHVKGLDVFASAATVDSQLQHFLQILEALQGQVNNISNYEARILTLESEIDTLQAEMVALSNVDSKATLNANEIVATNANVQLLQQKDDSVDITLASHESRLTTLEAE